MCINLPVKIVSIKNKKIIIEIGNKKKEISGSLIKVREGDYVFFKNNFIIGKINKKEAEKAINFVKNNL